MFARETRRAHAPPGRAPLAHSPAAAQGVGAGLRKRRAARSGRLPLPLPASRGRPMGDAQGPCRPRTLGPPAAARLGKTRGGGRAPGPGPHSRPHAPRPARLFRTGHPGGDAGPAGRGRCRAPAADGCRQSSRAAPFFEPRRHPPTALGLARAARPPAPLRRAPAAAHGRRPGGRTASPRPPPPPPGRPPPALGLARAARPPAPLPRVPAAADGRRPGGRTASARPRLPLLGRALAAPGWRRRRRPRARAGARWSLPMSLANKVRPGRDVVFRELGGETVLLNLRTGVYYGLNETGAAMWSQLVECRDPARVLAALARDYAIAPDRLARDLKELIAALTEKGLLEADEN